jgi:FtsZ-binding cell division protein ZapB
MEIEAINLSDMFRRAADAILTAAFLPVEAEKLKAKINELGYEVESERDRNKALADEISQVRQRNADLVAEQTATIVAERTAEEHRLEADQLHAALNHERDEHTRVVADKRQLRLELTNTQAILHSTQAKLDQLRTTMCKLSELYDRDEAAAKRQLST